MLPNCSEFLVHIFVEGFVVITAAAFVVAGVVIAGGVFDAVAGGGGGSGSGGCTITGTCGVTSLRFPQLKSLCATGKWKEGASHLFVEVKDNK